METAIPEKLLKIADEIEEHGTANLTKLTVLKKWFEHPDRLSSFAMFIANRASGRKGKTTGEAATLFHDARALIGKLPLFRPEVPRQQAEEFYHRLKNFQNEYDQQQWGPVRIIHNRNLFMVEEGLRIYLWPTNPASDGYHLAAYYCENYDSRYGNSLNGPSRTKILEIMRFMFTVEAMEGF